MKYKPINLYEKLIWLLCENRGGGIVFELRADRCPGKTWSPSIAHWPASRQSLDPVTCTQIPSQVCSTARPQNCPDTRDSAGCRSCLGYRHNLSSVHNAIKCSTFKVLNLCSLYYRAIVITIDTYIMPMFSSTELATHTSGLREWKCSTDLFGDDTQC